MYVHSHLGPKQSKTFEIGLLIQKEEDKESPSTNIQVMDCANLGLVSEPLDVTNGMYEFKGMK